MRITLALAVLAAAAGPQAKDNTPPEGFIALFNGKDLTNWQGLVEINSRDKNPEKYAAQVKAANEKYLPHWKVEDGLIHYDGKGQNLQTSKDYGDFEMWVDWKITPKGDSGIYLRGNPQVQIWDFNDNKVGSGGLYNNYKHPKDPLKCSDKPIGQWNTFRITMRADVVNVWLNGDHVVVDTPLDNYWDRKADPGKPLPATGPIELQHHHSELWFKNIYLKELR
jgi:hypothetical protein